MIWKLAGFSSVRRHGSDRRKSVRFPCSLRVTARIQLDDTKDPEWAMVQNISADGIGLVLRTKMEPNRVVKLSLTHLARAYQCRLPVRIVYVDPHPFGHYVVGGTFTRKLTKKEAAGLL
jgi:hypothetical protein